MSQSTAKTLHQFVFRLDKVADRMLKKEMNISFRRTAFLTTLLDEGPLSQHAIASALGISDPAVSLLLVELVKAKYVVVTPDPNHGRKRIVRLTKEGTAMARKVDEFLNRSFDRLVMFAEIDEQAYHEATNRLMKTLLSYEERRLDNNN